MGTCCTAFGAQAKADALGIDLARVREVLFNTFYASPADPDAFVRAHESGDPM